MIEDDPATREVLARELGSAGYRVVEAEDARTGLERFATRRPVTWVAAVETARAPAERCSWAAIAARRIDRYREILAR